MLTIAIEYITGYAVATEADSRERAEWPPHPARVFMAMTAAHFAVEPQPDERQALLFLEELADPQVIASEADSRVAATHYVPVNDALGNAAAAVPYLRDRQPRLFPRSHPIDPRVFLCWPDVSVAASMLEAIERLCSKVTRIGHSSSLVRVWAIDAAPSIGESHQTWEPTQAAGDKRLRSTRAGLLDELVERFHAQPREEFDRLSEVMQTATGKEKTKAKAELKASFGRARPEPLQPNANVTTAYRRKVERGAAPRRVAEATANCVKARKARSRTTAGEAIRHGAGVPLC